MSRLLLLRPTYWQASVWFEHHIHPLETYNEPVTLIDAQHFNEDNVKNKKQKNKKSLVTGLLIIVTLLGSLHDFYKGYFPENIMSSYMFLHPDIKLKYIKCALVFATNHGASIFRLGSEISSEKCMSFLI